MRTFNKNTEALGGPPTRPCSSWPPPGQAPGVEVNHSSPPKSSVNQRRVRSAFSCSWLPLPPPLFFWGGGSSCSLRTKPLFCHMDESPERQGSSPSPSTTPKPVTLVGRPLSLHHLPPRGDIRLLPSGVLCYILSFFS